MKNKKSIRLLTAMLIASSLLLAAVACAKAVMFSNRTTSIDQDIRKALDAANVNSDAVKQFQASYNNAAEKLKKESLFSAPATAKAHPVKRVDAILGSSARINDKWYEVGDTIGEAKLVAVSFAEVTILWDGKETKFSPISSPTTYAVRKEPEPVVKSPAVKKNTPEETVRAKQPEENHVANTNVQEDPLAWAGVTMSPELRAKILEKWNQMTDTQKAEAKKQWQSMSPDQRQRAVDQMEMMKDRM